MDWKKKKDLDLKAQNGQDNLHKMDKTTLLFL